MSDSPAILKINDVIAEQSQEWLKNIGYIALCISILLFLIIKILKYLLARKKFKFKITNSTPSTPDSITPILNRSFCARPERAFTP